MFYKRYRERFRLVSVANVNAAKRRNPVSFADLSSPRCTFAKKKVFNRLEVNIKKSTLGSKNLREQREFFYRMSGGPSALGRFNFSIETNH
jgi:hypothetical protein